MDDTLIFVTPCKQCDGAGVIPSEAKRRKSCLLGADPDQGMNGRVVCPSCSGKGAAVCKFCREPIFVPEWSTVWHHSTHGGSACRRTQFAAPEEQST